MIVLALLILVGVALLPKWYPGYGSDRSVTDKNNPAAGNDPAEHRFQYFDLLKNLEVIVEKKPFDASGTSREAILQVGRFRNADYAVRRRDLLLELGLSPRMDIDSSGVHHLELGPFNSRSEVQKTRELLLQQGIESIVRHQ